MNSKNTRHTVLFPAAFVFQQKLSCANINSTLNNEKVEKKRNPSLDIQSH